MVGTKGLASVLYGAYIMCLRARGRPPGRPLATTDDSTRTVWKGLADEVLLREDVAEARSVHAIWRYHMALNGWRYSAAYNKRTKSHPACVDWASISKPDQATFRVLEAIIIISRGGKE